MINIIFSQHWNSRPPVTDIVLKSSNIIVKIKSNIIRYKIGSVTSELSSTQPIWVVLSAKVIAQFTELGTYQLSVLRLNYINNSLNLNKARLKGRVTIILYSLIPYEMYTERHCVWIKLSWGEICLCLMLDNIISIPIAKSNKGKEIGRL